MEFVITVPFFMLTTESKKQLDTAEFDSVSRFSQSSVDFIQFFPYFFFVSHFLLLAQFFFVARAADAVSVFFFKLRHVVTPIAFVTSTRVYVQFVNWQCHELKNLAIANEIHFVKAIFLPRISSSFAFH